MNFLTKTAMAAALMLGLGVGTASATTLDLIGFTDNVSGEKAVEGNFAGDTIYDATYIPIAMTLRGYSGSMATGITGSSPYAYLDRNQAGAGVCKVLSGTQCSPSNDDNLTSGEILGVSFAQSLFIESFSFRGEAHPNDPAFGVNDMFDLSLDGGITWMTLNLINAKTGSVAINATVKAGTEILFAFNNQQYYLSAANVSAVPVPASGILLLSALGGLVAIVRRRRQA